MLHSIGITSSESKNDPTFPSFSESTQTAFIVKDPAIITGKLESIFNHVCPVAKCLKYPLIFLNYFNWICSKIGINSFCVLCWKIVESKNSALVICWF